MNKIIKQTLIFSIFTILNIQLFSQNPSIDNYILQQSGFASGNDPTNPPTSANYILKGSAIGVISGEETISTNYNNLPGYYLGEMIDDILPPENVTITIVASEVQISWSAVSGACSYKVFSSDDPQTSFIEDTSGTFSGTNWTAPLPSNKKFYYVKAIN
ncbi:MAG: hypothetical protein K8S23_01205 [Candidatus Cloacimonetes bacterium]|nr:hypothetical protein [Candidatus Cloacimonadota bacterium]